MGFIEFEKGFNLPTAKGTFHTIGEESHSLQYQRGFWVRFSIIQQKSIFLATICNKTIYESLLPCLTREERVQSKEAPIVTQNTTLQWLLATFGAKNHEHAPEITTMQTLGNCKEIIF
jgi:hypothetical protein